MFVCPRCGSKVKHDHGGGDASSSDEQKDGPAAGGQPLILPPPPAGASDKASASPVAPVALAVLPRAQNDAKSTADSSESDDVEPPVEKKQRVTPASLRLHAERLVVRQKMLRCIPGISKVRAEAICAVYPTVSALLGASVKQLESVPVGKTRLGSELAVAVKRVFE
jgi:hypothetical protein